MADTKRCVRCRERKPLDEFHRKSSNKDGRDGRCKDCVADTNREQYMLKNGKGGKLDWATETCCGVCGKPMKRPRLSLWLCKDHGPKGYPGNNDKGTCGRCPQVEKCRARVRLGIWVFCERPTRMDIRWEQMQNEERLAERMRVAA